MLFAASHQLSNGKMWAEDLCTMTVSLVIEAENESEARGIAVKSINSSSSFHYYKPISADEIDSVSLRWWSTMICGFPQNPRPSLYLCDERCCQLGDEMLFIGTFREAGSYNDPPEEIIIVEAAVRDFIENAVPVLKNRTFKNLEGVSLTQAEVDQEVALIRKRYGRIKLKRHGDVCYVCSDEIRDKMA